MSNTEKYTYFYVHFIYCFAQKFTQEKVLLPIDREEMLFYIPVVEETNS